MAKNGKGRLIIAIIVCTVFVGAAFAGAIIALGDTKHTAESAKEDVAILKGDGCEPAKDVDRRVIVLETKWDAIDESIKGLYVGQQQIIQAINKDKE